MRVVEEVKIITFIPHRIIECECYVRRVAKYIKKGRMIVRVTKSPPRMSEVMECCVNDSVCMIYE